MAKSIEPNSYYDKKAKEFDELKLTYLNPNNYKRFFFLTRFDKVFNLLNPKKGEKILDIGCGPGFYVKKIAQKGTTVWATEISKVYLAQAKKYAVDKNTNFILSPTSKLPFQDGFFDKILYTEVIEHDPDYLKSIKEVHRVLKPGGILVISTPSKFSPMNLAYELKKKVKKYEFDEHVKEFSIHEFRKFVGEHFKVKRFEFVNYIVPYPFDNIFVFFDHPALIKILRFIENFVPKIPVLKYLGWTMTILAEKEK